MGVIFKLAINNLRQQKSKTIIIGLFIAIGMMIVQVGNGFIESVNNGMEKDFRANYTADIIVSAPIPDGVFMDLFGITDLANVMEIKQIPALPDAKAAEKIISETSGILQKSNIVTTQGILFNSEYADFQMEDQDMMKIPVFYMFAGEPDAYFKMFPNQKITEGRYPAAGTNEILVDERLKKNFYEYYKSEMELNQTIYISGVSMQTLIREAKIVGFYNQPDENSAMYSIVYADPSLARAFADLTYGANFVQELPDEINFDFSTSSEDDLFGSNDDLFASDDFGSEIVTSGDVSFDDILGDTTLRDELNKTDDGAWHYILLRCEKGMSDVEIDAVIEDLNNKFAAAGVQAVARNWAHAAGTFTSSVESISSLFTVLIIILAIVVFIIIMNTMVISVLERTGEIGTMRAIGANKSFVRKLFFCESITLTLGAEIVGTILSLVVMGVLNLCNFTVSDDIAKMILGGGSISFIPTVGNFVSTMIIILVGTILANLYPVSSALKITPLKALSKGDA